MKRKKNAYSVNGFVYLLLLGVLLACGCKSKTNKNTAIRAALAQQCMSTLTSVIVRDVVAPPVASRMYAYASLAYYEGIRLSEAKAASLTQQFRLFKDSPKAAPNGQYDYSIVALEAFQLVATQLVFSKDSIQYFYATTAAKLHEGVERDVVEASISFGQKIGQHILQRSTIDHYKETRGMPRYTVFRETGKWQPTAPDYVDALEPYWGMIAPLLLDSGAAIQPPPPPAFNMQDKSGVYYKAVLQTYQVVKQITPAQDSIARFWDDNAFVTEHKGHLVYATKKTTPCGHWMSIAGILSKEKKYNDIQTAYTFAITASAMFDGFISCWAEKYNSRMIRPITVIKEHIDEAWWPILQTPPFPEYTSGHSVISAAAATVLTKIVGPNFAFTDTTEIPYLQMQRSFSSIEAASDEAGISRLYGGIHYMHAIAAGKKQGQQIGAKFCNLH
ncbi:MAG: hypothetical protein RLY16_232 [Bacteroidota bacterium]